MFFYELNMIINLTVEKLVFLPLILIISLFSVYTDIKFGKIKNKLVFYGYGMCLFLYVCFFSWTAYVGEFNLSYFLAWIINAVFCVLGGYLLWHYRIWSAGDGKLFIVIGTFLPVSIYSNTYFPYFPALVLLINIFIVGLIYLIFNILKNTDFKVLLKEFKESCFKKIGFSNLISSFFSFFLILFVIDQIFMYLKLESNVFYNLVLMFLLYKPMNKIKKEIIYLLGVIVIGLLLFDKLILSDGFWKSFIYSFVLFKLLRSIFFSFFNKMSGMFFVKEISVYDLKEGMMVADVFEKRKNLTTEEFIEIEKTGAEILKPKSTYYIRRKRQTMLDKSFIYTETEGLTKKDIKKIQRMNGTKINIYQSMSFGLIVFMGLVLTILFGGLVF